MARDFSLPPFSQKKGHKRFRKFLFPKASVAFPTYRFSVLINQAFYSKNDLLDQVFLFVLLLIAIQKGAVKRKQAQSEAIKSPLSLKGNAASFKTFFVLLWPLRLNRKTEFVIFYKFQKQLMIMQ